MKNQLIIFSKNRACQLNLLLDSIKENAPLLFDHIYILYKSDFDYIGGYEKLKKKYPGINFKQEVDFRIDLINLIDSSIEATTLMVDDAVVYDKIYARKIDIIKSVVENKTIFSLRLGKNCTYSHPANLTYKLGEHEEDGEYINFDFNKQENGDFKYPLSTDGHIYNTEFIKDLLITTHFKNPNTLEANIQTFVINGLIPTKMKCFNKSKLVSIPVNLVNDSFKNRYGLQHCFSEKELNDRYLNNETIYLPEMDFTNINGPHKEIEYKFKNNGN